MGFGSFVGTKRCTSIQNKARHNHNKTNLWDRFLGKQSSSLTKGYKEGQYHKVIGSKDSTMI